MSFYIKKKHQAVIGQEELKITFEHFTEVIQRNDLCLKRTCLQSIVDVQFLECALSTRTWCEDLRFNRISTINLMSDSVYDKTFAVKYEFRVESLLAQQAYGQGHMQI